MSNRLPVLKTYKLFIGGAFPRTESGRYFQLSHAGTLLANMCMASRKDFRNAVVAARKAQDGWQGKTAMLRSQIIYRIAEMLEGRRAQFIDELIAQGCAKRQAEQEVDATIDRCIYYSGWADKYQALASCVNPVASNHFNFSVPEPMGVVAIMCGQEQSLLGIVSTILPCILGGNTCVLLASQSQPLCSISLAEVLATSDLPAGVVNILTGSEAELHEHYASHMDVNAIIYAGSNPMHWEKIAAEASRNVKRSMQWNYNWLLAQSQHLDYILQLQEIKTTWHPIENIGVGGAKY